MPKNEKTTLGKMEKLLNMIIRDILYIKKNIITKNDVRGLSEISKYQRREKILNTKNTIQKCGLPAP